MNKVLKEFIEKENLKLIFLTKFGSHLYGTNTPESDEDYKGVYLPTKEQCFLNEIQESYSMQTKKDDGKNSKEDVDIEIYSIHYYLKLLFKGDTGALDMLHAPVSNNDIVIVQTKIWEQLRSGKSNFYTTNLSAFVGYCRTQASKYGVKGSRLNDAKEVVDFLSHLPPYKRLQEFWYALPKGDHIHFLEADPENGVQYPMYQVCGKKLQSTVTIEYAVEVVSRFYTAYGKRAQMAANNEGIDWKAVSHAVRCAYEMIQVFEEGDITFPLKFATTVLSIKEGLYDYTGFVAPLLEELMDKAEKLSSESNYPKKVNQLVYKKWLLSLYEGSNSLSYEKE